MKFSKWSKDFILDGIIPMLVFLEHDGLDAILHYVVWPDDLGTVDLKMTGEADSIEGIFQGMDTEKAQLVFDTHIKDMMDAFEGEEDQPGG